MLVIAVKLITIVAIAIIFNIIQKKMIPRAIIAATLKIRDESNDQRVTRTKTMAYFVTKIVTTVVWIIVFVMALGVVKFNITPLLATLGVAGLGLGFAIQNIIRDYTQLHF